jgi:hypothetical protein
MKKINFTKGLQPALGAAGGAVAAQLLDSQFLASQTSIPEVAKPFIPIALGVVLLGMKNPMVQGAGAGMVAVGAVKAYNAFTEKSATQGIAYEYTGGRTYLSPGTGFGSIPSGSGFAPNGAAFPGAGMPSMSHLSGTYDPSNDGQ